MTSNGTISKCPKCSSDMIKHPSSVSMPLSSSPNDTSNMRKIKIEDQDANFVLNLNHVKSVDIASSICIIREAVPEFNCLSNSYSVCNFWICYLPHIFLIYKMDLICCVLLSSFQ